MRGVQFASDFKPVLTVEFSPVVRIILANRKEPLFGEKIIQAR
jgi:hypothetical protein